MTNKKAIQIPIYEHTLQVIFGDKEETREALKEFEIKEEDIEEYLNALVPDHTSGSVCYFEKYDDYYLWMPKLPVSIKEYGTLVHELEHFVYMFLDIIGFNHSNDSDEAYAYLLGFMFCEVDVFINELKDNNENTSE